MAAKDLFIRKLIFDPKYGAIAQFARQIPTNPSVRAVRVGNLIIPKKVLSSLLRTRLPTYRIYRNDNDLLLKISQNRSSDKNILWLTYSPNQIFSDTILPGIAKSLNIPPEKLGQTFSPEATSQTSSSTTTPQPITSSHPSHPPHLQPLKPIHHEPATTEPDRTHGLTPPTRQPQPEEPFFQRQEEKVEIPERSTEPPPIHEEPLVEPAPQPTEEPYSPPRLPFNIRLPSFAQDIASNAKIIIRRVATKPIVQQTVVAGLGGGAAGALTFGLPGGLVGGLVGGSLPSFNALGGFKMLGFGGGKAAAGAAAARAGVAAVGAATGPPGWIVAAATVLPSFAKPIVKRASKNLLIAVLLIVGFILLALFIPSGGLNFVQNNALFPPYAVETGPGGVATTQNRVEIVKTVLRDAVPNGGVIEYKISVTYRGTGTADIRVTDTMPNTVRYISASDNGSVDASQTVTWPLTNLQSGIKKELDLTVQALPEANDSYVFNQAQATIGRVNTPTVSQGDAIDPNLIKGVNNFNTLIKGQGRNTSVLGDEESFVQTVLRNGAIYLEGKESYVRILYRNAVKWRVNPLAILSIWGTETGFRLDLQNTALSCPVRRVTDFNRQTDCAGETYDDWMKHFERNNQNGTLQLTPSCVYDDPFIFATEKYGPTCAAYDGNDHFLSNFVIYYKRFAGAAL